MSTGGGGDGQPPARTVALNDVFDPSDRRIKEDMLRMILSYLNEEGYHAARLTLQDEANVKAAATRERHGDLRAMRKAIKDGDWAEVERLIQKLNMRNNKTFLYEIYKQQYLEMLESGELQKAFAFLLKRLKPLESMQSSPDEFRDLCYLLSCKSVQDAASFRTWEGIGPSRERLMERFQSMLEIEPQQETTTAQEYTPPDRLVTLMRQAVAYQLEFSAYRPKAPPKITTLLENYSTMVVPNVQRNVLEGHLGNVKCVKFLGEEGAQLASGSSDNTIRLWRTSDGVCTGVLRGHTSRIWDLSSSRDGAHVASASADGTVRLWDARASRTNSLATFAVDKWDLYTVQYHPGQQHLVTGGYDKAVRLVDIRTGAVLKAFSGHRAPVCATIFNPYGNLVISASKDRTVKFWDMTSGICVNTVSAHIGEVTSIAISANGMQLLTCGKDNSNRIWDMRNVTCKRRLKGHQNTSKNFVRADFGARGTVVGGSEDGIVYIWDTEKPQVVQRLRGHDGIVYEAVWNTTQGVLASCGEDRTVRLWGYNGEAATADA